MPHLSPLQNSYTLNKLWPYSPVGRRPVAKFILGEEPMRFVRRFSCFVLTLGLAGLVALPLAAAEDDKKPRDPAKTFSRRDTNGDGKLSLDEFKAGMKEPAVSKADQRFKKIDTDGDGSVSLKEFTDSMKAAGNKKK
jgi:hypothetical protein